MAWWLSLDRLSAEERLLVGRWTFDGKSGTANSHMRFDRDRRFVYGRPRTGMALTMVEWAGRWFIRDGAIILDGEREAVRRTVRPILRSVGLPWNGALTYRLESITADEMVLVMSDGTRESWTRAPAE
jgi:hypothetical protein